MFNVSALLLDDALLKFVVTEVVLSLETGDLQDSQDVSASEMTYIVLGGALNSTYSLTFLKTVTFHKVV